MKITSGFPNLDECARNWKPNALNLYCAPIQEVVEIPATRQDDFNRS